MPNEGWNIGYYLTGTDLSEGIRGNISQIERALPTTKDTEVFVLWDQAKNATADGKTSFSYPSGGGQQPAWNTTGIAKLSSNPSSSDIVQTFFNGIDATVKKNSGTFPVFSEFLDDKNKTLAKKNQNALFFGSHGAGILGGFNTADTLYSTVTVNANLDIKGLKPLLDARLSTTKYDIIAFDECLMGAIEVAYELRGRTDFVVASQEVVPGNGNNYINAFKGISNATTPSAFATQLVNAYTGEYSKEKRNTLSAIELSKLSALAAALKSFSDECVKITDSSQWTSIGTAARNSTNYKYEYMHDLGQFLKNITKIPTLPTAVIDAAKAAIDALGKSVIAKTTGDPGTKALSSDGLTIILPATTQELKEVFEGGDQNTFLAKYREEAPEFMAATNWDKFLSAFLEKANITNADTPTSTKITQPDAGSRSISKSSVSNASSGNSTSASSFLSVNEELISLTDDATNLAVQEYSLASLSGLLSSELSFQLNPGYGSEGKVSLVLVRRTEGTADQILASISGNPTTSLELKLPTGIAIDDNTLLQVVTENELINYDLKFTLASGIPFLSTSGSNPSTAIAIDSDVFSSGNFLTSQTPEKWFKFTTARTVSEIPEDINLYSTGENSYFNLDIYATNPDGSLFAEPITDSSGTENIGITFQPNSDSIYYIKVSSKTADLQTSNLDFSLISSQSPTGDGLPTISGLTPEDKEGGDGLVNNSASLANISAFISLKNDNISDYGYYDPRNPATLYSWKTGALSPSATGAIDSEIAYQASNSANVKDFYSIFSTTEAKSVGSSTVINASVKGLQSFGIYATQKDGTILRSQDANGSITNVGNNTLATLGDSLEVSISSGIFQTNVPTSTKSKIDLQVANIGAYTKELLTYQVDGITGGLVVNGRYIDPTDKDYARYAVERASSDTNKSFVGSFASTNTSWELEGEKLYGTIILTNTDAASFLANNPMNQQNQANQNAWFSLGSANPDGLSHFTSLGNNTYGFEDTWGGGSKDFNDLVFNMSSSQVNLV